MRRRGRLAVFGLSSPNTDLVVAVLCQQDLWRWGSGDYDPDAIILTTTRHRAKDFVMSLMGELDLLSEGDAIVWVV